MRQALTPRWWSLRTTKKTHDIKSRAKCERKLQKHNLVSLNKSKLKKKKRKIKRLRMLMLT